MKLEPALRDAFRCHHQRAAELLKRREVIAAQLRGSSRKLQALVDHHGGSGHCLDQALVQRRQQSLRSRLKRWFVESDGGDNRRNAAEQLLQLAHTNSDLVHEQVRLLKRQHQELQRQLSALDLSGLLELTVSDDAAGVGEARLRLLESHGLCNGEQLRANIDRLQALPGIGAGLQQRLRHRLDQVVQGLEAHANAAGIGPGREDLVLLPELLALQNGEQQLQALGRAMATFTAAIEALQTTISDRRSAMETQLKAFEALC